MTKKTTFKTMKTIVLQCIFILLLDNHAINENNFLVNDAHAARMPIGDAAVAQQKTNIITEPLKQLEFVDGLIQEHIANPENNIYKLPGILSATTERCNIIHSICFYHIMDSIDDPKNRQYTTKPSQEEQIYMRHISQQEDTHNLMTLTSVYHNLLIRFESLKNSDFILPHIKSLQTIFINTLNAYFENMKDYGTKVKIDDALRSKSLTFQQSSYKEYQDRVENTKKQSFKEIIDAHQDNPLLNGKAATGCFKINSANDKSINIGKAQLEFVDKQLDDILAKFDATSGASDASRLTISSRLMMLLVRLSELSGSAIAADGSIANKGIIHATCFRHIINSINDRKQRLACLNKPIDISNFSIASYFDSTNVDLYELLKKYTRLYEQFERSGSNNPKLLEDIRSIQEIISVTMNNFFMENKELKMDSESINYSFTAEQRELQNPTPPQPVVLSTPEQLRSAFLNKNSAAFTSNAVVLTKQNEDISQDAQQLLITDAMINNVILQNEDAKASELAEVLSGLVKLATENGIIHATCFRHIMRSISNTSDTRYMDSIKITSNNKIFRNYFGNDTVTLEALLNKYEILQIRHDDPERYKTCAELVQRIKDLELTNIDDTKLLSSIKELQGIIVDTIDKFLGLHPELGIDKKRFNNSFILTPQSYEKLFVEGHNGGNITIPLDTRKALQQLQNPTRPQPVVRQTPEKPDPSLEKDTEALQPVGAIDQWRIVSSQEASKAFTSNQTITFDSRKLSPDLRKFLGNDIDVRHLTENLSQDEQQLLITDAMINNVISQNKDTPASELVNVLFDLTDLAAENGIIHATCFRHIMRSISPSHESHMENTPSDDSYMKNIKIRFNDILNSQNNQILKKYFDNNTVTTLETLLNQYEALNVMYDKPEYYAQNTHVKERIASLKLSRTPPKEELLACIKKLQYIIAETIGDFLRERTDLVINNKSKRSFMDTAKKYPPLLMPNNYALSYPNPYATWRALQFMASKTKK